MRTPNRCHNWRRFSLLLWMVASSLIAATSVAAQEETTYLTPNRDPESAYAVAVEGRVATDMRYVDETNLNLLTGEAPQPPVRIDPPRLSFDGGNFGVFFVVLLVASLLFIFLKFGAGGALFQSDPNAEKKPRKKAKAWGLTATEGSAGDIMSQIRAMASRRDALILLLRHCLLRAADETETNFLRADTEREALGRLPKKWRRYPQLQKIMFQTELVHYGGRDIADDDYETALTFGAQILMEGR